MNILFLTMSRFTNVEVHGIYTDLMRKFRNEGHEVYIVTPLERRFHENTNLKESKGVHILGVKMFNVQKTNVIEKGLGQISIEWLFKKALKKYLKNVSFDLVLYSTPPITFSKVITYVKQLNPQVHTYLLLKDIFPQNAVDLGMVSKGGIKGLLYHLFRRKEKLLYKISDFIGCMSPANVDYVIQHNSEIDPHKVEVAPNSIEITDDGMLLMDDKIKIRKRYGLPLDKPIFIYGGNLGKPQGVSHLIKCLDANKRRTDCHFVVIGSGTELPKLFEWHNANQNTCVSVMKGIPKADYDALTASCDVGLIFLDYRFTIPNYPSRLLTYLQEKKPIIACTDPNCDTGSIAEANGYGYYCPSNDVNAFTEILDKMLASDMMTMGNRGYEYLCQNYLVEHTYHAIMKHFE